MKKLTVFVILIIMISLAYAPIVSSDTSKKTEKTTYEDEIDQEQTEYIENILMPVGRLPYPDTPYNIMVAQSFIPTLDILTRLELYIGKNSTTTYPFTVGIRDDLTDDNLVETTIDPDDIPTEDFDWVEADVDDTWLDLGQTYYIVCSTENISDNWYVWRANNNSESYPYGCMWYSIDDGDTWGNDSQSFDQPSQNEVSYREEPQPLGEQEPTWDMCFKTYGVKATTLEIELTGGLGMTGSIKNTGNNTAYDVEVWINITGGIFGLIHLNTLVTYNELEPGQEMPFRIGPVFGLGKITLTITARAYNAREVSTAEEGLILFIFIIF